MGKIGLVIFCFFFGDGDDDCHEEVGDGDGVLVPGTGGLRGGGKMCI